MASLEILVHKVNKEILVLEVNLALMDNQVLRGCLELKVCMYSYIRG